MTHCDEAPRAAAQRWRAAPSLSCDVPCEPPPLRRAAATRVRAFVEKAPVTRNTQAEIFRAAKRTTGNLVCLYANFYGFSVCYLLQLF